MTKIKANNGKFYTLPANPVWHSGPPPSVGWWPCSDSKFVDFLRFWDGEVWSLPAFSYNNEKRAAKRSNQKGYSKSLKWCARWWE